MEGEEDSPVLELDRVACCAFGGSCGVCMLYVVTIATRHCKTLNNTCSSCSCDRALSR